MATFTEVTEGLAVLARHLEKGMESGVTADRGIIAAPEAMTKALPQLDIDALERLGWHFSDEQGCWSKFV